MQVMPLNGCRHGVVQDWTIILCGISCSGSLGDPRPNRLAQVPPDRMNVIGIVLGVIIFDQETWTMDTVMVGPFPLLRSGPGKMDVFSSLLLNAVHPAVRYILGHTVDIIGNKTQKGLLLGFIHIRTGEP